ncbi:DUF4126 domain-containing protein [Candidatus Omnitrophota bacterium]
MNILKDLGMLLGGSWASGINLYLTIAGVGIAGRAGWVTLPGKLEVLSHPLVIFVAVLLFLVEFFADKIPYVDSAWDSFHTAIRPVGAAILTFMALSEMDSQAAQLSLALLSGSIALDAHLTKATTRVAINTSPEPFTNIGASVSEDALVIVALWLVATHPVIAGILVISFVVFSIWFLKTMFRFLKKVFTFIGKKVAPEKT